MTESLAKTPFDDIIQSDLFTFHVGEERKPFLVHSKAVAATSQVFDRLINGGMSEAQSRSAELRDVDPETFIRFLEFAYRHDYTDPPWSSTECSSSNETRAKDSDRSEALPLSQELNPTDEDLIQQQTEAGATSIWTNSRSAPSGFGAEYSINVSPAVTAMKKSKKSRHFKVGSRAAFESRNYVKSSASVPTLPLDLNIASPSRTFTPIFLAHARLYTFANMYMVSSMRDLSLYRLHRDLVGFPLHPERLEDVVELVKYAYEHGEDRSEDGKVDAMRDLVINYVVCEIKVLGKHVEFRNLMDGGGEFAGDFWDIVQELI